MLENFELRAQTIALPAKSPRPLWRRWRALVASLALTRGAPTRRWQERRFFDAREKRAHGHARGAARLAMRRDLPPRF